MIKAKRELLEAALLMDLFERRYQIRREVIETLDDAVKYDYKELELAFEIAWAEYVREN